MIESKWVIGSTKMSALASSGSFSAQLCASGHNLTPSFRSAERFICLPSLGGPETELTYLSRHVAISNR